MRNILFILAGFIVLTSCNKEKKLIKRLNDETWNIVHSERAILDENGGKTVFEDLNNAGSITFRDDPSGLPGLKQTDFEYTNYLGQSSIFTTTFYANEDGTRVGFAGVLCSSPFECDLVFTVDENKSKRQVWSAYGSDDTFFFPPDPYNANKPDHIRWKITLEKQ